MDRKTPLLGAVVGVAVMIASGPAAAAPIGAGAAPLAAIDASSLLIQIQGPPPPPRPPGPPGGPPPRRGGISPGGAAAIGAAVGIIGGMIAAEQARQYNSAVAECMRRFRSYNPETGYYIGRDGRPRACP
jgi:hypothetical protein